MERQAAQYDAIVIGFGKGGKTLAGALGNAGRRTVLVEKSSAMYGGTCINVGCIPTKYLVHKSQESRFIPTEEKGAFYTRAIQGKNALTARLREKNLAKAETTPNVTVLNGTAKLLSRHQVEVTTPEGVQILEGTNIFLNTGSVPFLPPIPGLKGNPFVYTSEGLLALETLPKNLVIIGGGYIGVEFASIYADFGSRVTVIQDGDRFLPREDAEIAQAVLENLQNRGATVLTGAQVLSIEKAEGHANAIVHHQNQQIVFAADAVLVATGRRPNTADLGLENAGVALTPRGGLVTNEHLQTTADNIYAMGDVVGGLQFTYVSLDDYRVVRSHLLSDGSYTTSQRTTVPYSVFLNPPFSRVGLSEEEALAKGYHVKVARMPAAAIPKSQVLEQPSGLLKAVIDADTNQILGAHLFCEESHEMINLVKLAMDAHLPYTALRDMIFTHPTMSEALNDLMNV